MNFLCKNCNKISPLKFNFALENKGLGIFIIFVGLFFLIFKSDLLNSKALLISYSLFLIVWGFVNIARHHNKKQTCPECKARGMLIAIDTPEAQQIIKENNLEIPK